jgi:Ca2+-binding RTX toxin-like protein
MRRNRTMSGKTRIIGIAAALALAGLGAAANAEAATVSVSDGDLTYTAAAGERNGVTIAHIGYRYDVRDAFTPVQAGEGCAQVTPYRALCNWGPVQRIIVRASDRDDLVRIFGEASRPAYVYAGAGDDTVTGTEAGDGLNGDGGDDRIDGRGGDDRLVGGTGSNVLRGSAGDDELFAASQGSEDFVGGGEGDDRLNTQDDKARDRGTGGPGSDVVLRDSFDDVLQ